MEWVFFVPSLVCEKLIIVEEKGREGNIRKRKKEPRKIKKRRYGNKEG